MAKAKKTEKAKGAGKPWTIRGEFTTGIYRGWISVGRGKCEAIFRDMETAFQFVDDISAPTTKA